MRIYMTMPIGDFYGWAICGKNLFNELHKDTDIKYVPYELYDSIPRDYKTDEFVKEITSVPNGKSYNYIQAIENNNAKLKYKGEKNVGYMFYESEHMDKELLDGLAGYDVIATGSDWNSDVLRNHGFENVTTIHQGVDTDIFHPKPSVFWGDKFVVYSGGKIEHRKGQDIVAYCVGEMQKKYKDVYLITAWDNIFELDAQDKKINQLKNYLDPNKTMITSLARQVDTLQNMCESSIGLFPNRYEGGTNLVMMEYMACGKPVIATNSTGQADVLDGSYSYQVSGSSDGSVIEQCMEYLEYAYHNRDELQGKGVNARESMKEFTWNSSANKFKQLFEEE